MSTGITFIFVGLILLFVVEYNKKIDTRKFIKDTEPYLKFLMEDDYEFLLHIKYGSDVDIDKLFNIRIRNGIVTIFVALLYTLTSLSFMTVLISVILGYVVFKSSYSSLKRYYKANLHQINLMLPYYLKSLEILIQHYTVPVALARSIDTAPSIFQSGLKELISKIDSGDRTVDPYMDFAQQYPVRDSMRMMRLLYRLGLGSQENKQEQLMMFSRTVSNLQNKSREQKYKERLDHMEKQTMVMLMVTGSGILLILLLSMMMMMNV